MDLLRNLFGNVTSGIIRLAVAVGIIAAVGFFILKPILSSTDRAFDTVNEAIRESGVNDISRSIDTSNRRVQRQIERQIRRSFRVTQRTGDTQKLVRCIQRARPDPKKIERCTRRY
jgi:hypothetical protein